MWRQQGRRARNRQSYDVAEEAAIHRALRESLRTAAAEKSRDDSSSTSTSSDSSPSPSPKEQHVGSKRKGEGTKSHPPAKRMKLNRQKNSHSTLARLNSVAGHLSCQSPAKLSVPPSPMYERSSPVISESDSLKLMLSTSSDSSSPSSPYQDPSSKVKPAKKNPKKSTKVKRVLLAEFSTSTGQKIEPMKGSKSTSKQKKKNEEKSISDGAAKLKNGKKRQHTSHHDSACSSKVKAAKAKQITPGKRGRKKKEISMTVADNLSIGNGLSSTLTSVNLPDIRDSGAAETVIGDGGSPSRAEGDDSKEECGEKLEQQKTATFTCTYSAQRKFASNHTPPARFPERELIESQMNLKEVPRTQDFITFLCLRGSSSVPEALRKFSQPWTPILYKRSKTMRARSDNGKISKSRQCGNAVKKLIYPIK